MTKLSLLIAVLFLQTFVFAKEGDKPKTKEEKEEAALIKKMEEALKYTKGAIPLADGKVTLNIPAGFKFLDATQSDMVITKYWGNPPGTKVLGMIMPANAKVMDNLSYAFVLTYDEDGYVKDSDAEKIDYDELMKNTQAEEPEINKKRKEQGYDALNTVGWAQKPFYDKDKKILHWAKELKGEGSFSNTLNYDVRILGRKGVFSMNAVGGIAVLDSVKANINKVIAIATFNDGFKYEQFDSKTDKIAAYTIGGLVGAKVLAKVGLLAKFGKFLGIAWKFILIGLIAVGGFFKKFFTKKKEEDFIYEPQTKAEETQIEMNENKTEDETPTATKENKPIE